MHFELDLAIAYACTLALVGWLASWFVPLLLGSLVRAIGAAIESWRASKPGPGGTPPGADPARLAHDWWGPTHHSH